VRRAFVATHLAPGAPDAAAEAKRLAEVLARDARWRLSGACGGWSVWTRAEAPFPIRSLPGETGLLVGDVFDSPGVAPCAEDDAAPDLFRRAARLSHDHWGHYAALLSGPRPGEAGVFRDPSGLVDCWRWSLRQGLDVIASDLGRLPRDLQPRGLALNWDRIGVYLAAPPVSSWPALFDDVRAVGPGELLPLAADGVGQPVWSPTAFARAPITDLGEAAREVRTRLDICVEALVGGYDQVLVELSGGLDSSLLAGSIHALGLTPRVGQWLNGVYGRPEADEGVYARAVTDRIGVELETVRRAPDALVEADLMDVAGEIWPAMDAVDAVRDRDEACRLRALGARAIVSGQGGDGAFFQMPSALVAADELQRRGPAALAQPLLADVARRARKSVWAVLAECRAAARSKAPPRDFSSLLIAPELRCATRGLTHPWVQEALDSDLPPGKRLHIQAAANLQTYHGPSRRRREADLLLPLASQPVLELCLAIPTPDLAGGNYDRPFARKAFADRLPELVLQRRSKGIVSVYFAKLVANSAPMLRDFLLDGCLCRAGLLDRDALDQVLRPEQLIWTARASDVLWAATVEAWVRHWQRLIPDSLSAPRARG
jgi:asparagine synthase (glutamine-hydrolysing)